MSEVLYHLEPLPSSALKPCANMFPSVAQRCLPVRILPIAYAPKWTISTAAGFSETFKFQSSVKNLPGMENSVYFSSAGKEMVTTTKTHRLTRPIDGSCSELPRWNSTRRSSNRTSVSHAKQKLSPAFQSCHEPGKSV